MVYTPVHQIALIVRTDEAYVRKVIRAFNKHGFESLNPKVGTGRPKPFDPPIRERIVASPFVTVGTGHHEHHVSEADLGVCHGAGAPVLPAQDFEATRSSHTRAAGASR